MLGGEGKPLTASLLPNVHIAILEANDILPDLDATMQYPALAADPAAAFISGHSRTDDIELTITLGVH